MSMKSDEWIRYVTGQFVEYIETPKSARKQSKRAKEGWGSKWFGILPMSVELWSKNTRLRKLQWRRLKLKRNPRH